MLSRPDEGSATWRITSKDMIDAAGLFPRSRGTYLLNHSVGVPPLSVRERVADVLLPDWFATPHEAWSRWMAEVEGFHAELGRLLNHDPEWFCHQTNVSSGLTKVIQALPFESSRPVILLSEQSFPTLGYVAQAAQRLGYRTRMLPDGADGSNPDHWSAALANDVGIALVTHAESNAGIQLPVESIVAAVHAAGAVAVVDVAQSAGVLPIDLCAWRADVVVGTSVKWVCGGPGAGFLWVDPAIIDRCSPIDVGWFSHADPFEFDIHDFRFAPDARRFLGGTPSPIPTAVARESLVALNNIGVAAIREHNLALTERLIDGLDEPMLVSPRERHLRSGTVVIDPGPEERAALLAAFSASEIHVDERADGIRISPHLVNSVDDIDAVLEVVHGVRKGVSQ